MNKTTFFLALALTYAAGGGTASIAAPPPLVIATGPVAAFAFPLGGEICRFYESFAQDRARCTISATDGSLENLKRLQSGEIQLALVQSDVAADAVSASGPFSGAPPFSDLRSILGFYPQALTILVRGDGVIKQADDLKGQRIAVGAPGQPEPIFTDFLEGLGWSKADLGGVVEMARGEQAAALCNGKVAAIVFTAPHPNGFVREAIAACHAAVLDLAGPALEAAVAAHPAYAPARLDMGVYGGQSRIVQSFGPRTVLMTTVKLDREAVERLIKSILGHIDDLKKSHPAFSTLDGGSITSPAGLGAERHPAAAKYMTDNKLGDTQSGE